MARRSVVLGSVRHCPSGDLDKASCARRSTPPTSGLSSGPGSVTAISPAEGETTASLATDASRKALEHAGVAAADIDHCLATATHDQTFPSSATKVRRLSTSRLCRFDVHAVCTAFSMPSASPLDAPFGHRDQRAGHRAETFSRILDWRIARPASCSATVPARWSSASRRASAAFSPPSSRRRPA